MNLFRTAVLSSLVLGAACRQFAIPEVANAVAKVINKLDSYVHYHGNPTETAVIPASSGVPSTSPQQSTPYWYEEITHQGISAFGPSGYVVYRNVKDYGATGIHIPPVSRIQC
jgi:glucan 1,3-beta-glucosidase